MSTWQTLLRCCAAPTTHRWLGLLPLAALSWAAYDYWRGDKLENLLWVCDVANLMLAIGLISAWPTLRRTATVLVLFGTPLWIWELTVGSACSIHSVATHVGSALVGVVTWREAVRQRPCWKWCTVTFVLTFLATRMWTPPGANVNVAFAVHPGVASLFTSFPLYTVTNLLLGSLAAFGLEKGLIKTLPDRTPL